MLKIKRRILVLSFGAAMVLFAVAALIRPTVIYRGVNYEVSAVRMPLYLKAFAYLHRHLEYKNLAHNLVGDISDPHEYQYAQGDNG